MTGESSLVYLLCTLIDLVLRSCWQAYTGVYGLSEKGREGSNKSICGYSFQEEICAMPNALVMDFARHTTKSP